MKSQWISGLNNVFYMVCAILNYPPCIPDSLSSSQHSSASSPSIESAVAGHYGGERPAKQSPCFSRVVFPVSVLMLARQERLLKQTLTEPQLLRLFSFSRPSSVRLGLLDRGFIRPRCSRWLFELVVMLGVLWVGVLVMDGW